MLQRRFVLLAGIATGCAVFGVAGAQNLTTASPVESMTLEPLHVAEADLRNLAVASQQKIDRISGARLDMLSEYRRVQKEISIQKLYNDQIRAQIAVQEAKKKELAASIKGVDRLQRQIPPLALKMLEGLKLFIELDLPFETERRLMQVERVRESLNSADIKPSEQLRQILELYDIELQYSRTIDAYEQFIDLGGAQREVSVLRWGRMALIYMTLDERAVGIFDSQSRSWEPLPASFRNAIRQGLRMARKQASLDMLLLPVPAPVMVEGDKS